jgi:hypothetical protein
VVTVLGPATAGVSGDCENVVRGSMVLINGSVDASSCVEAVDVDDELSTIVLLVLGERFNERRRKNFEVDRDFLWEDDDCVVVDVLTLGDLAATPTTSALLFMEE